ncbi:hypothetical protein ACFL96_10410 [Thermoproteota archaeon]
MDISNIPHSSKINRLSEQIAPIIAEDLTTSDIEKRKDKKGDPVKSDIKKKKAQSSKPTSVSLFHKETDAEDMVDDFFDKAAIKQSQKQQAKIKKDIEHEMKQTVDTLFEEKTGVKAKDSVLLSSAVQAYQASIIKEKETKKDMPVTLKSGEEKVIQSIGEKGTTQLIKTKKSSGQGMQTLVQLFKNESSNELKTLLKEYLTAFSDAMVNQGPQKEEAVKELRQKLLQQGYSTKNLRTLEGSMKNMLRSELKTQIKNAFIKYALSFSNRKYSSELIENKANFNFLSDVANLKGVFGEGRVKLAELKEEAKSELRFFLADELDSSLAVAAAKGDSTNALAAAFDRFNTLASIIHFNPQEFIQSIRSKLDDLGDSRFIKDRIPLQIDADQKKGSSNQDQDPDSEQQQQTEELQDELRFTLMQNFIQRGFFHSMKLKRKLRGLKKQLKNQSSFSDEDFEKLKKEAKGLARMRFIDMLREAYEVRATLPELNGTEYEIMRKKEKTALKGLASIGYPLDEYEKKQLIDKVNKSLFPVIKEEYLKIEVYLETNPKNIRLLQNRKNALAILERLRQESNIKEDIRPKSVEDITFTSDTNVIEAA